MSLTCTYIYVRPSFFENFGRNTFGTHRSQPRWFKTSCPCQKSKPDSSAVQPVALFAVLERHLLRRLSNTNSLIIQAFVNRLERSGDTRLSFAASFSAFCLLQQSPPRKFPIVHYVTDILSICLYAAVLYLSS